MSQYTSDGGPDPILEEILEHASEIEFFKANIEDGLLTHGDRNCEWFFTELRAMKEHAILMVRLIEDA